jgi:hypothetical protein
VLDSDPGEGRSWCFSGDCAEGALKRKPATQDRSLVLH